MAIDLKEIAASKPAQARSRNVTISRFGHRKKTYTIFFTFLLSVLALLLLSLAVLSKSYARGYSIFTTSPVSASGHSAAEEEEFAYAIAGGSEILKIVDTVMTKIIDEVANLREHTSSPKLHKKNNVGVDGDDARLKKERTRYTAFLVNMLGLVGSIRASLPRADEADARAPPETAESSVPRGGEGVAEFFLVEEIRKYIRVKPNRLKKQNFMGANGTFTSIGHGCFAMKKELEEYMDYDVGDYCKDDWKLAQRLMVHGCDPLPRRRCFSRAPQLYTSPLPINESLWSLPDDRNVRWSGYRCKNFTCLARNATGKGFFKCADCFNLTHHEAPRWMPADDGGRPAASTEQQPPTPDFPIAEVLGIKPAGEIRVGLDFSAGTGSFAARMRQFDVTVATATINYGAPFSEVIALRGLLPLYATVNQRLPFFDNTLDIVHTTRFLDGWIDLLLLDFVLYDWDRVLRPGGLLWIDAFFCRRKDLDGYLGAFGALRYKKHRWVVVPKLDRDDDEVFFSAVLEKPPRPFR